MDCWCGMTTTIQCHGKWQWEQTESSFTTDSQTLIDHIFSNIPDHQIDLGVLETYFRDYKAIWASCKTR